MKRKLVCLLLAVVMLSAMAVTAFAVDTSSWPTEIHAGCPDSDAFMHYYATGTIYNNSSWGFCVEGRMFRNGVATDGIESGAGHTPAEYFPGGTGSNPVVQPGWYHWNGSKMELCHIHSWANNDGVCAVCFYECIHGGQTTGTCGTCGKELHAHSYADWTPVDKTSHKGTCTCGDTSTVEHAWVRSADGATTSCATCGAYVTVTATSGVTPKTVKDCVTVTTNLSTTPDFVVMDTSNNPAVNVALTTSAEGNYQAIAQVATGVNPYADFTLTNPTTTAATGDNRPIELLVAGFAAMAAMAAAAFTVDRKRR